jgi:signal transduction histidine kinase
VYFVRRRLKDAKKNKLKEIELVLNSLEAERARLSKDLHDGVSPNLSALKMVLNNADLDKSKFTINPDKLIDATLAEIKEILHNITPDTLKQNGLASTISSYITNTPYENLKVNFNTTMLGVRYSEAIEINVYRIFQELFNNALKYSGCKEINVDMFVSENALNLMVADDGKGFNAEKTGEGFGIQNIKSRVELLQGTVNFDSSEFSGTTVILKIPLHEKH